MSSTSTDSQSPDARPTFEQACAAVCAPGTLFEIVETDVGGVPTKVFAGAPPSLRTLYELAAGRTDDYIIYEDERWRMSEVLALAGRIGSALVHDHGVTKGDRVAIGMRNRPEWVAAFVAITSIGAVAVPLNAWWQGDEMAFALEDSTAKVVLLDGERLRRLRAHEGSRPDTEPVLVATDAEGDSDGIPVLSDELLHAATMPRIDIDTDDDATILYTSGTTGHPKGAVSTHRAVVNALMGFAARQAVNAVREPESHRDQTPVIMLPVPLFHVTGLIPILLGSFVSGARLVMTHRWHADRALELIERERVTTFIGVPTMSWDLLEAESFGRRDVSSLVSVGGGGSPMPPKLVERIDRSFPNAAPGLGYGMTETNALGPQNSGRDFLDRPASTGRVVPIMDLRVTDPDGTVLGPGETGEIWFRGPNLIRGYWNRPEATAETIVDGWLRSGDIGRIDEDGFVYVSDRAKDMVLRGGENVYCAEVEAVMYHHPAVYEAAVFGIPDERLGEQVAAVVMAKPGMALDGAELCRFLGEHLAFFKVPSRVRIVDEPLPRNASGKILKRSLRGLVADPAS